MPLSDAASLCSRSPPNGKMRPSTFELSASLCEALRGEETEMVEILLKRGADPSLVLPDGIAAIHLAAGMEQESGVRCLGLILQYGGDPNVRSVDGLTPLHVAASWGCYTCLKLLLMEGGDTSLEDQDGNRAVDLAMEQGNEMCVRILQQFLGESRLEQNSRMSHRRTESFLSTDTKRDSEIGSWLSEDDSFGDRTLKSPSKASLEDEGPGGPIRYLVGAAPNGNRIPGEEVYCSGEHPSNSLLTEDTLRQDALCSQRTPHAPAVASSSGTWHSCRDIPGNLTPSRSTIRLPKHDESLCPKSEGRIGGPQHPCFRNTTDGGWRSSANGAASQGSISPDSSVVSQSETPKLSPNVASRFWGSPQAAPLCAIQDAYEAETEDADATLNLSRYKSFLDPDLVVKVTGQEGLDVTSPDHAYLFPQLNSTAALDLEKTVVDLPFLARARGKLEGCQEEGKSLSDSSDGGGSQYASCNSECSASFSEGPCDSEAQKYAETKADFFGSPCRFGNVQRNSWSPQMSQGPCSGVSQCCSGEHAETLSVPVAGRDTVSPIRSGGTRRLCERSHFREVFSKIYPEKVPLDLHNGQSECLEDVKQSDLPQMSQDELQPTENWNFSTLPLRESQSLSVPDDSKTKDTAPSKAPASVIRKEDSIAELQQRLNGAASAEVWAELNVDAGKRPVLGLSQSTQGAAERGGDSWGSDTILIQQKSEEMQPLPVSQDSTMPADDPVAVPHHTLNIREETPDLEMRLRTMMLATKAHRSPLLPLDQRPCHVTPRSKSRTNASASRTSGSASLFDETLEMPRRPRRVRSLDRMAREAGQQGAGLRSRSSPCLEKEQTSVLQDTELIAGSPRSCQQASWPQSHLSGPNIGSLEAPANWSQSHLSGPNIGSLEAPANSGRKTGTNGSSREAAVKLGVNCHGSLVVKPPTVDTTWLPREGEEDCTDHEGADAVASGVELGNSDERHGSTKRPPKPSRVSFSRLSAREPSSLLGRFSPLPERLSPSPNSRNWDVPLSPGGRSEDTIIYDWQSYTKSQAAGPSDKENSCPRAFLELGHLSDETLVRKLRDFGVNPGPVTELTRKVYMQLLEKLMSDPKSKARKGSTGYSPELSSALETYHIPDGKDDEMTLSRQFDQPDKNRKWREGVLKSSFNYLLLDPRVTQNLPFRSQYVSQQECFRTFISAIFYVGKGKRSRPYYHLYEALTHFKESRRKRKAKACPKVQHILEIWASGEGVISMHCFQNVIPVEAYTREASMVDAIGLKMLTNQKRGDYYGVVAGWPMKRRRCLGIYLLHRAMQIFLAEGERQLRPADIHTS
uniref:Uncharacterized protein n=1 Tax=Sphaerodactylus townsendi TaxID=933632 RepID=A0ACB8F2M2_9SAUR